MKRGAKLALLGASQPSSQAHPSLHQQPCQSPSLSSPTRMSALPAPETPEPHPIVCFPQNNHQKRGKKRKKTTMRSKIKKKNGNHSLTEKNIRIRID